MPENYRVAILGGGPSGLFMYKRLIERGDRNLEIVLFEAKSQLGAGMPYSREGAEAAHVTNVSDHEVAALVTSMEEWVATLSDETLHAFGITAEHFNARKVVPRLLFGKYLTAQFELLKRQADARGIRTTVHLNTPVTDLMDDPESGQVVIEVRGKETHTADAAISCIGHRWPTKHEGNIQGYFDSPYPPSKLALKLNHPVALKGSSLTAIDAICTLARHNGTFEKTPDGQLVFRSDPETPDFKLVMHSRNGLLPAVRIHREDLLLARKLVITDEQRVAHCNENGGFLSLDYIFEKNFKVQLKKRDPAFYDMIKNLGIEDFVDVVMEMREKREPFELFKAEYAQAERSIRKRESIDWKEALSALSFSMNYPAKYLSAEDTLRLQRVLMPLISVVIAFVPQSSCEELFALHDAGMLDIISVGSDSEVIPNPEGGAFYQFNDEKGILHNTPYKTFVDCVGQPHLHFSDFPFKGLMESKTVSPARIKFKAAEKAKEELANGNKQVGRSADGSYYLEVKGITITDDFQTVDHRGIANDRIYIMAVPYIGGYNPDYSGLDFCSETAAIIAKHLLRPAT